MTAFTSTALEVELTAGNWTDITTSMSFASGPLTIRQGRPTRYNPISAAVMSCALWNDDGKFMPGNQASTLFPYWAKGIRIRWKVTKGGTTYTRFVGWIQAIAPTYPGDSTSTAVVQVTATDALGLLAQRKLRSNFTETCLWRGAADTVFCDAWEGDPETTGIAAYMTNYSTDASPAGPVAAYSGAVPVLRFGADNDVDIGAVASCGSVTSCKTLTGIQAGALQIMLHLKGPTSQVPTGGPFYASTFHTSPGGASSLCHLAVDQNGAGVNGLWLRNAAGSANLGLIGNLPLGNWVKIHALSRVDNAAHSDWYQTMADGTTTVASDLAVDLRTIRAVEYPAAIGSFLASSWGGVSGLGTRTPINWEESFPGATTGTLASRVGQLGTTLAEQLPVTIATVGTLTSNVATGRWSGRTAAEVLHEMMATYSGLAWARGRDSVVYAIGSDQLYPLANVATISVDTDTGSPALVDGSEEQPSRVDASWPGGKAVAVNRTLEAAGTIRSVAISTIAPTVTVAAAAGQAILDRSGAGVHISRVAVDLLGGSTDHTAALLSESTTLGGLFPTQRARLVVPTSHFGVPTRDVHVQGWQEAWGPDVASIALDTTPAISIIVASEGWTGSNGAAWSGQWSAAGGGGTSGATVDIQSNRGRILNGAGGDVWKRITTFTAGSVDIIGLVQVQGTAEAQLLWRADSTLANGYALIWSVSGGVRIQQIVAGVITNRYSAAAVGGPSISASTDYRFRLRHQGAYLSVRVWAASGSEPGTWSLDTTDTLFTASGYVALRQWTASQTALFDDLFISNGA